MCEHPASRAIARVDQSRPVSTAMATAASIRACFASSAARRARSIASRTSASSSSSVRSMRISVTSCCALLSHRVTVLAAAGRGLAPGRG